MEGRSTTEICGIPLSPLAKLIPISGRFSLNGTHLCLVNVMSLIPKMKTGPESRLVSSRDLFVLNSGGESGIVLGANSEITVKLRKSLYPNSVAVG